MCFGAGRWEGLALLERIQGQTIGIFLRVNSAFGPCESPSVGASGGASMEGCGGPPFASLQTIENRWRASYHAAMMEARGVGTVKGPLLSD